MPAGGGGEGCGSLASGRALPQGSQNSEESPFVRICPMSVRMSLCPKMSFCLNVWTEIGRRRRLLNASNPNYTKSQTILAILIMQEDCIDLGLCIALINGRMYSQTRCGVGPLTLIAPTLFYICPTYSDFLSASPPRLGAGTEIEFLTDQGETLRN